VIIKKYGLIHRRVKQTDIEMIRHHRNAEHIRKQMFYQKKITQDMQQQWFQNINSIYHYYFIIEENKMPVGLVNLKDVDYSKRIGEGGLFLWDESCLKTTLPVCSAICMLDFSFQILQLKTILTQVREDNLNAIHFNERLGYESYNIDHKNNKINYFVSKDAYYQKAGSIRQMVMRMTNEFNPLSFDDIDLLIENNEEWEQLYMNLPSYILKPCLKCKQNNQYVKTYAL